MTPLLILAASSTSMHNEALALFPCGMFCCFAVFGLAALGFTIWMLVDAIQNEPSEGNDKLIWVLVIILGGWIGALVYFFVRRGKNRPSVPPPQPPKTLEK